MDAAHTPMSCASLVSTLQAVFPRYAPLALIVAMASDKDCHGIISELYSLAPQLVVCVDLEEGWLSSRCMPAHVVASTFSTLQKGAGGPSEVEVCVASSIRSAEDIMKRWLVRVKPAVSQHTSELNMKDAKLSPEFQEAIPVVCITGSNYVVGSAANFCEHLL